jgi:pyruvate formate-lyase activating enzyme-like uncharacterized protein
MEKTPYYSYRIGKLAKGCNECVKGNKSVYFITGLCSSDCFFCPISDEKKNKDVIYINEWPTKKTRDISREIELCSSTGVGMTGGDPLLCMDRTVKAIRLLKKKIDFHIHLYTPLDHVDRKKLARLAAAGLDEIRFHPDIDDDRLWERLELAREFDWDVGIEIPVIPGKLRETKRLLDFIAGKVDFLNLNELEFSDTNYNRILEHGFKAKDDLSYAVKGSDPMAKALLRYVERKGLKLRVHYCTAKLKDKVQLSGRMKRRSSKASLPFDIVTEDGLLIRGAIYLPELFPGFDYRRDSLMLTEMRSLAG